MAPIIRQPTGGGGGLEPADIGVTVQGYDSDLAAIAALTTTANGRSLLTASALTAAGLGLTNGAAIDSVGASPLTATTAASTYMPLAGGAFSGAVTSTSSISSRQSANTVQFLVASGTAQTINWNNGGNINLDLSSATGNVTLTLQNPVSGATYRMRVQQGANVRNLIFPASTVQQGGGGTTYTGISGVDFLTVYYNGSAYLVQSALNSGFIQPTANAAFTGVTQLAALRLNTYAVIVSTTAPTTRTDSSALVAGDLWFKPIDNGVPDTAGFWVWQSPYWLGATPRKAAGVFTSVSANTYATTQTRVDVEVALGSFLVESIRYYSASPLAVNDVSNYWDIVLRPDSGNATTLASTLSLTFDSTVRTATVNTVPVGGFSAWSRGGLGIFAQKTGSPSNLAGYFSATIRDIHP